MTFLPKLRPVTVQQVVHEGRPSILLQDPLHISHSAIAIPVALAPLLALCDGSRTLFQLRGALAMQSGIVLSHQALDGIFDQLDQALMLDNDRFRSIYHDKLDGFRHGPHRDPMSAGRSYPADPGELRETLRAYMDEVGEISAREGRGVISPHIDYARGGPVYARTWKAAAEMVREAERIVILGTDHSGTTGKITPTRQHYATPLGVAPTDREIVDAIVDNIGETGAFEEEFNHIGEHSIELALVWIQFVRGESVEMCPVVPILTGSFYGFVTGERDVKASPTLNDTVQVLRQTMRAHRTLIVATGDLAHIGPAFDTPRVDAAGFEALKEADEHLMAVTSTGDPAAFFGVLADEGDSRNVCGLPPIYLMLRALQPAKGEVIAYDRCPADDFNTSYVSICGMIFE